jgi:hypothetical protein
MIDGHGGDCGGAHFVDDGSGCDAAYGIPMKPHEVQPLMTGPTINGAAVIDQSREYLMDRKDTHE